MMRSVSLIFLLLVLTASPASGGIIFDAHAGEFAAIEGGDIPDAGTITCDIGVETWYSNVDQWAPSFMLILADASGDKTVRLSVAKDDGKTFTYRWSAFEGHEYEYDLAFLSLKSGHTSFKLSVSWTASGDFNVHGEDQSGQVGQTRFSDTRFEPSKAKVHVSGMKGSAQCSTHDT